MGRLSRAVDAAVPDADRLAEIVAKASGLFEPPGEHWMFAADSDLTAGERRQIDERLRRWREIVSPSDSAAFERRLAECGLDSAASRRLVGPRRPIAGATLPAWAELLAEAYREAAEPSETYGDFAAVDLPRLRTPDGEPTPFQELLLPFLCVARRRLFSLCRAECNRLSAAAHDSLLRPLLARLGDVAWRTFELEFAVQTAGRTRSSAELYQTFAEKMLCGGLFDTLCRYPVLGRLLGTLVQLWIESSAEFLRRLNDDWAAIQSLMELPTAPASVRNLRANCSDSHHGGRTVHVLEFELDGRRVIYKPKDLRGEQAFARLVDLVNAKGATPPLRAARVLVRDGYGWAEFIADEPPADEAQTRNFHQRAGMLLALAHALGAVDLHSENLVASGEHPVLVDLETIMSPTLVARPAAETAERLANSILRTGLLPFWRFGPDSALHNQGGLAPDGRARLVNEHLEDVVAGFNAMHRLLIEHRPNLLSSDGPLADFAAVAMRVIARPTQAYAALIEKLNHPRWLASGVERGIELEVLARSQLAGGSVIRDPRAIAAEQQALERLDIPTVGVHADGHDAVANGNATIPNAFAESAIDTARRRIAALDDADRGRQVAILRSAFQGRLRMPVSGKALAAGPSAVTDDQLISNEQLIAIAVSVADGLRDRALFDSAGRPFWIGLQYSPQFEHYCFEPLGFNLYNGAAGVALFIAAVQRLTGGDFATLARGALKSLCDLARRNAEPPGELGESPHGFGGWSSAVYVLVRMSQLLDEPTLIDDAERLAAWVTPNAIATAERDDVLTGVAGTTLSLLALYSVRSTPHLLQMLSQCGTRLARHAIQEYNDDPGSHGESTRPLTGLSHGAAGVAYSLCRLAEAIGDSQYREAAKLALAYEYRHFDPATGGWADFRSPHGELHATSDAARQASWCHGAPGIALGRIGVLKFCSSPAVLAELDFGLRATADAELPHIDTLCCGAMGQIDALLEAAQKLDRPELRMAAARRATIVLDAAQAEGGFALFNHLPRWVFHPGLFQGIAGIGYELLRLAVPDIVPSVLLMA